MQIFWKILLGVAALSTLWFGKESAQAVWTYRLLKESGPGKISSWDIQELSPSKFALKAFYTYSVEGKEYTGETLFHSFYLPNVYAAESEIDHLNKRSWKVWYSPKNPSLSSLEKSFPYKAVTYLTISFFILIYFWIESKKGY
jgi:hypothetical protein